MQELYHHGIKGQKWGVRKYQYADGTLTPEGLKRYRVYKQNTSTFKTIMNMTVEEAVNNVKFRVTGKQYVDSYIKKGTTLNRIQTAKEFENFAFFATYNKDDSNKYLGLFGNNLTRRANGDAKRAEKLAEETGNADDIENAKKLREYANNLKVYQLNIEATNKLKIPSDNHAGDITAQLLKDKNFKNDAIGSIEDSKTKMKRFTQQMLFNQAQKALHKNPNKLTNSEKIAIYKAINLSLTNHNDQEIRTQNRLYSELKKKGYNALLDYNDKEFSSYHAKRPIIVFDTDSVTLKAITETNQQITNKLYNKYNKQRLLQEIPANTIGYIAKSGSKTMSEIDSYVRTKIDDYYNSK